MSTKATHPKTALTNSACPSKVCPGHHGKPRQKEDGEESPEKSPEAERGHDAKKKKPGQRQHESPGIRLARQPRRKSAMSEALEGGNTYYAVQHRTIEINKLILESDLLSIKSRNRLAKRHELLNYG